MPSYANNNGNRRYHVKTGDGFMKRLITDKRLKDKLVGCSDMRIWRLRREEKLPKPKKLGNRSVTPEDQAITALIGL